MLLIMNRIDASFVCFYKTVTSVFMWCSTGTCARLGVTSSPGGRNACGAGARAAPRSGTLTPAVPVCPGAPT